MLNFAPDGSDLQYSMLMGAGTEDVLSVNIGADGNYYVAKVSYDSSSLGFTTPEGNQEGPAGSEGPAQETGPEGPVQEPGAEGPAQEGPAQEAGQETIVSEGPLAEGENPGPEPQVEEYFTEGGDSPANDPALQEEASDGITSPADEAAAAQDAEARDAEDEELQKMVSEVREWRMKLEEPIHIENGYNLVLRGRFLEGIEVLQPYTEDKIYAEWWPLWYYLGTAYKGMHYFNKAEKAFLEVLRRSPSNDDVMRELVDIYEQTGEDEKAEKYRKKIQIVEENREAEKAERNPGLS